MTCQLKVSKKALREIDNLPGHVRQRLRRTIALLRDNPGPAAAIAMKGDLSGYYRIRVDVYRIIYWIEEEVLIVEIIRVARRTPRTYEGLE